MAAEFKVKCVETTIGSGQVDAPLSAPGDYDLISDVTRCMLLPAGSWHHTVGTGWQSGTFTTAFRNHFVSAELADDGSITCTRGFAGTDTVGASFNLIEYIGPHGGPNEFIRRHHQTVTLAAATTTIDSSSIAGVSIFADLVPVVFIRSDANTNDARHVSVKVDVINTGGVYTVRLTRTGNSGNVTAVVYVYEMTGSNWTVQRIGASITVANTKQDQTLTSVTAATAFVLRTFQESQSPGGPAYTSPLVWVSGTTTLSARAPAINSTSYVAYVISNPSMSVQLLAAPDGTNDWTAGGGSAAQSQPLSFSSIDTTRSCIVGQAGSDDTTAADHTSELWAFKATSDTAGTARRGRSFGGTEHVTQVIQFPQDLPNLTAISSTIRTGSTAVIDGTKLKPAGVAPTVTMGGVSQTVSASSDTQITVDIAIGSQIFGDKEFLITTAVGSASITAPVLPPSGQTYFNLSGGLAASGVLTAIPDITDTAQIWTKEFLNASSSVVDVTDLGNFQILPNSIIEWDDGVTVAATVKVAANNNNGTGWGPFETIILDTSVVAPTVVAIPPLTLANGVLTQFDLAPYAAGEDSVTIIGSLPTGLTMTGTSGFVSGTPTVTGVFTLTVRFTNGGGSTDTPFELTVLGLPTIQAQISDIVYSQSSGSIIVDFGAYVSGATSYSISPTIPVNWEYATGTLFINPPLQAGILGPYTVTATNAAGSVDLDPFTVTAAVYDATVRTQLNTHLNVIYFSDYFGAGGSYSITPAVPTGWLFYSLLGRIVYGATEEGEYSFVVTDTLTGRSLDLTVEIYSGVLSLRPRTSLREFLL